ncbi:MAG: radical SAM protein [Armatimonadetes bacterium]|nr:radical SAM protein [Armatimonadota bacterium]
MLPKIQEKKIKEIFKEELNLNQEESANLNKLLKKSSFYQNLNLKNLNYIEEFKNLSQIDLGITESCNLKCRYCSANAKQSEHSKSRMSIETFKNIINLFFCNSAKDELLIVFRGGEPLLCPISWYEEAITYAKNKAKESDKSIKFSYSTNATLIDESWIEFFEKYNLSVCFSIDGYPEIHNKIRGQGEKTIKAIKMLKASKIKDKVGSITVVSKVNYDKMIEILEFLLDLGITANKFNACYPLGRTTTTEWLTPEHYLKAKIDLFFGMLKLNCGIIDPNLINQVKWFFQGRQYNHYSCENMYCIAGRAFIFIDSEGNITACDRAYQDLPKLGNVNQKINLKKFKKEVEKFHLKNLSYEECATCKASKTCTYGCTAYTYTANKNDRDLFDCKYNLGIYDFLRQYQNEAKLLLEKLGKVS